MPAPHPMERRTSASRPEGEAAYSRTRLPWRGTTVPTSETYGSSPTEGRLRSPMATIRGASWGLGTEAASGRRESVTECTRVPWVMALKKIVSSPDDPSEGSENWTTSGVRGAWRSMYSLRFAAVLDPPSATKNRRNPSVETVTSTVL